MTTCLDDGWVAAALAAPKVPEGVRVHLLADAQNDPDLTRPRVPLIPFLAYPGLMSVLVGGHKIGKSTLARDAIARATNGDAFLGAQCQTITVLWAGLDEPLGDVIRGLLSCRADASRCFLIEPPVTLVDLVQTARALRPSLLVIDTLADLASQEGVESENDALPMRRLLNPLRLLAREMGMAVLILHHARKSDGTARGSGAIGDIADLLLTMSEDKEVAGARLLKARGRVPLHDIRVRWAEAGFERCEDAVDVHEEIRLVLRESPGITVTALRERVGRGKEPLLAALNQMKTAGQVCDRGFSNRSALFLATIQTDGRPMTGPEGNGLGPGSDLCGPMGSPSTGLSTVGRDT